MSEDESSASNRASPASSLSPSPATSELSMSPGRVKGKDGLPDFEDTDFYISGDSVTLGPTVGEGAFSTVYVGRYFGDVVAVKKQTRQGKDLEKYLLRELSVLKYIRHENMLEYIGAYNVIAKSRGQLHAVYIITEYAAGGDLLKLLLKKDVELGWQFRVRIAREGAEALAYLHSQQLIHRDIKSSNFLLGADWSCKLSDFGMAREVARDGKMTICGTDEYMAPEMLFDEDFSFPADMYSYGMVLLELMTRQKVGDNGFARRTPGKLFALELTEVSEAGAKVNAPDSLINLAVQCLEYEPGSRPSAEDARDWLADLLVGDTLPPDTAPPPPLPPQPEVPEMMDFGEGEEEEGEANSGGDGPPSPADPPGLGGVLMGGTGGSSLAAGAYRARGWSAGSSSRGEPRPPGLEKEMSGVSLGMTMPPAPGEGTERHVFVPNKMGYLHVKNHGGGFRNWKKRWFVLKGGELVCYKDGGHIDTCVLAGCTIVRSKDRRFSIVRTTNANAAGGSGDAAGSGGGVGGSAHGHGHGKSGGKDELELVAESNAVLEAWLSAIQGGIEYANGQTEAAPEDLDVLAAGSASGVGGAAGGDGTEEFGSVLEWLQALRLEGLWPAMEAKGFTDIRRIRQRGLKKEDLDAFHLQNPLQRRFLLDLGRSPFREHLVVKVVGHRELGDVVMFRVVCEWRAWHSRTEKLFTDFNKMHNKLRRALKDANSPALASMPELPGKGRVAQNQRDPAFVAMRRKGLEAYLQELADLLTDHEPYFTTLLEALDILPSAA